MKTICMGVTESKQTYITKLIIASNQRNANYAPGTFSTCMVALDSGPLLPSANRPSFPYCHLCRAKLTLKYNSLMIYTRTKMISYFLFFPTLMPHMSSGIKEVNQMCKNMPPLILLFILLLPFLSRQVINPQSIHKWTSSPISYQISHNSIRHGLASLLMKEVSFNTEAFLMPKPCFAVSQRSSIDPTQHCSMNSFSFLQLCASHKFASDNMGTASLKWTLQASHWTLATNSPSLKEKKKKRKKDIRFFLFLKWCC